MSSPRNQSAFFVAAILLCLVGFLLASLIGGHKTEKVSLYCAVQDRQLMCAKDCKTAKL